MNTSDNKKKRIAIIGGGASALYLGVLLDTSKYEVCIYERNKALGRKFLVAGQGGFNLTHSEEVQQLVKRYTPESFLSGTVTKYDNDSLQAWLAELDIPTYIGSSKRIFPEKGMKPIEVLQKFLDRLAANKVQWLGEQSWTGWSDRGRPLMNGEQELDADIVVFALGGASWKVTGSDGGWLLQFHKRKIKIKPFRASNCAHKVAWPESFAEKYQGSPLKNIAARIGDKTYKGEMVVTAQGLEGNALYAISSQLREAYKADEQPLIYLDLKPTMSEAQVLSKLERATKNTTEILKRDLKLSAVMLAMVKEIVPKKDYMDKSALAKALKSLPIKLEGAGPIDAAISTVGGIDLSEVNEHYELKKLPGHFCIGEMLDWDAPTGGYLLQACYSMAAGVAEHLNPDTTAASGKLFDEDLTV